MMLPPFTRLSSRMMRLRSSAPKPFISQKVSVWANPSTTDAILTELSVCCANVGIAGLRKRASMPSLSAATAA